jgi:hypothetical protein
MSEAKIEVKVGEITFSGQGDQEWVAAQLDKILSQAEKLIQLASEPIGGESADDGTRPMAPDAEIAGKTLPLFLQEKAAGKSQVKKFLATAVWLEAKGQSRIQTGDVAHALKEAQQTRLGNPADCLNQNVAKGHCEKDGKHFFVTADGRRSL